MTGPIGSIDTRTPSTVGIEADPERSAMTEHALDRAVATAAGRREFDDFMASLPVSLSPSMIFAMLQKRMSSLDSQIDTRIGEISDRQMQLEKLNGDVAMLLAVKSQAESGGKIWNDAAVTHNGETKPASVWLAEAGITIGGTRVNDSDDPNNGRTWHTVESFTNAVDSLQASIKQLNQGNELRMMDIQSLMQQRSSEISLATNMLKSVQEGTDAIVRNMG